MSIRLNFTVTLSAIGVALFSTYALWAYESEQDDLKSAATNELRLVGQSLETSLGNALRDEQPRDIYETLEALEALAPKLDIYLHDPTGRLIASSHGAPPDDALARRAGIAALARTEQVFFDPEEAPARILFAGPLTDEDGAVIGSLAVARPTADLQEDLIRTRDRLAVSLLVFLLATMAAGVGLGTFYVSRPVARLLDGVRQVREGDFRTQVQPGREDELGQLVHEFNAMIAALAKSRARIESEAEARARLEIGLQHVDKLVTIGQLSAGLAHEIGSPLQVLSGRAALLLDHEDPEVRRQAGLLVTQCDRITRVMEQLLSFGRRKSLIGPCDLAAPVAAVLDLLGNEAKRRRVELSLEPDDGPHDIIGDPDQLQQVTLNLVRNALNATPPGGRITVRVDRVTDEALDRDQDRVRLSVRDTGCGIDAETQARLFEPFFTTRASEGGTGLGLAVVRSIANEHQAKIEVRSEPGAGSEFVVSFPYRKETDRA